MVKGLLVSAAIAATGLLAVSAQAQTVQEGRSMSMHHHYHTARHYSMMYGSHRHGMSYGVGDRNPRTTATGGNAGGYSTRN